MNDSTREAVDNLWGILGFDQNEQDVQEFISRLFSFIENDDQPIVISEFLGLVLQEKIEVQHPDGEWILWSEKELFEKMSVLKA